MLANLYLTVTGIIMTSLKSIQYAKINENNYPLLTYERTDPRCRKASIFKNVHLP